MEHLVKNTLGPLHKTFTEEKLWLFLPEFFPMVKSMLKTCLPEFFCPVKILCNGPLSDENKIPESLNCSVPALQADSYGIQIHGALAPPYIFQPLHVWTRRTSN